MTSVRQAPAIARPPQEREVSAPSYTTLSRLQSRLKEILAPALGRSLWLRAELASADERNGALYAELVETDERGGSVVARMRCTIWPTELTRIRKRFAQAGLDFALQRGSMIGVQCVVSFHPVHGLSVRGLDMDPAFVLGELEVRRRRILASLERDGLLRRNAQRPVPLLPNRILLITSGSGAAYHDFVRALAGRCGIRILLADSVMQGPNTEDSVLRALELAERLRVDLVVLIRGGGSKLDLGTLDSEAIARRIAALSVPVWTGIGHETNTTVLDAVAAEAFRTPTAAAEALAGRFERVERLLQDAEGRLRSCIANAHQHQRQRLDRSTTGLRNGTRKLLALRATQLKSESHRLRNRVGERVSRARTKCASASNELMRACQGRFAAQHRSLQRVQTALLTQSQRSLAGRLAIAQQAKARFYALRPALRLIGELQRIEAFRAALGRFNAQAIAREQSAIRAATAALRARAAAHLRHEASAIVSLRVRLSPQRVEAIIARQHDRLSDWDRTVRSAAATQLASKRIRLDALAPRLRTVVDVRARPALANLCVKEQQLTASTQRALARRREALALAVGRLSPERAALRLDRERDALAASGRLLVAHDPQRALERGFSVTYSASGRLVRSIGDVHAGESIKTRLADGVFEATVQGEGHDDERES